MKYILKMLVIAGAALAAISVISVAPAIQAEAKTSYVTEVIDDDTGNVVFSFQYQLGETFIYRNITYIVFGHYSGLNHEGNVYHYYRVQDVDRKYPATYFYAHDAEAGLKGEQDPPPPDNPCHPEPFPCG